MYRLATKILLLFTAASIAMAAPGDSRPQRPDLASTKPLATSALQTVAAPQPAAAMRPQVIQYATPANAEDPLTNYMRSARGEWQIAANVDRDDPWNRLLLLGPKQPLVIDVAIFIGGKPYRNVREAWIDDVLAAPKSVEGADKKASPVAAEKKASAKDESEKALPESPDAEKKSPDPAGPSDEQEASKQDSDKAADSKGEEKAAKDSKDDEKSPAMPVVDLKARQAPAIRDRLMNYLASIGPSVSRDEIRWLLAEWGSGPPLIVLGPGLSWQRAGAIPLLTYLDRDGDGGFSKDEILGLADHLQKADRDADDVLELSEIRRATTRPPTNSYATDHPLLVTLDDQTNWTNLSTDIIRIYGGRTAAMPASTPAPVPVKERIRRPDAKLSGDDLRQLLTEPADLTLRVDFRTAEDQPAGVSVISVGPELSRVKDAVTATADVVTLDMGSDYLEISAAGDGSGSAPEAAGSQVAVGAVVDGDPLLRSIDRDQDGRLTKRERQALADHIRGLDRDGDGQASAGEIPIPIRLAVTLGPQVHQLLAKQTLAARVDAPVAAPTAPAWFASMDKNNDGDLTRNEFLGTPDQFRVFDADGDGQMSVAEALKAENGK